MGNKKKNPVIGYITHTPIGISETFLNKMLGSLADEFNVIFYCGQKSSGRHYPCDVQFMGFAENEIDARWGEQLSRVRRRVTSSEYRMRVQEQAFITRFKKFQANGDSPIDFALIEYGTTAVVVAQHLTVLGIPYAINFHGYDASASLGDHAYRRRIKRVVADSKFFVVPSQHLRRRIELVCPKRAPCHVLPCTAEYATLPTPSKPHHPIVVSLGRLTEKKCPHALIMMASLVLEQMPQVQFKFIGGGPLQTATQALINELGLSKQVELLGALPHHESMELLASASLFVQHSVTSSTGDQEGFPVALAEAAALGKPIISTYHSGIVENVEHGKSGYLVQEHDYESMAYYAVELLNNATACEEMGAHGQRRIQVIAPDGERETIVTNLIRNALRQGGRPTESSIS